MKNDLEYVLTVINDLRNSHIMRGNDTMELHLSMAAVKIEAMLDDLRSNKASVTAESNSSVRGGLY